MKIVIKKEIANGLLQQAKRNEFKSRLTPSIKHFLVEWNSAKKEEFLKRLRTEMMIELKDKHIIGNV